MKIAPLLRALGAREDAATTLIHTGQHYDQKLSDVFFEELGIQTPDVSLGVGSGPHGQQTGKILERMEEVLQNGNGAENKYDRLVVVGDVNSTMAAALAAVKLGIPVAHVEAGLRSFDRTMPEEINRIVTDSISDLLLVSEPVGVSNLQREGHSDESIHLVGNVMIDTLRANLEKARRRELLSSLGLDAESYGLLTLHRPSNVDVPQILGKLVDVVVEVANDMPFVFPVHPRTRSRLEQFGLEERMLQSKVRLLEPVGYLDCLALMSDAKVVVTDSGGLQEETTALKVPCLTLRANTERPITVDVGTSTLIGSDSDLLRRELAAVLDGSYKKGVCPDLWDGRAAERIAEILLDKS